MCYITIRPTETWISKHILLVLFRNNPVWFSLCLSPHLLWCNICVLYVNLVRPRRWSMLKQWHQNIYMKKKKKNSAQTLLSLFAVISFLLPNEHRCLLIDSANSKTISGVAKTTQLMIYSLLIFKNKWDEQRDCLGSLIWLLRAFIYSPTPTLLSSHLALPLAYSCSPDRRSDYAERWSGGGVRSGGITMWANFNLPSLHIHQIPLMLFLDQPICYTQFFFFPPRCAKRC